MVREAPSRKSVRFNDDALVSCEPCKASGMHRRCSAGKEKLNSHATEQHAYPEHQLTSVLRLPRYRPEQSRSIHCSTSCRLPLDDVFLFIFLFSSAFMGLYVWTCVVVQGPTMTDTTNAFLTVPKPPVWSKPAFETRWTVFYTIFVADSPFLATLDQVNVEEQLEQIAISYAASAGDLVVYYNFSGGKLDMEWLEDLCSFKFKMECRRLSNHFENEEESSVVTKLQEFCLENEDKSVVYLKNRGSTEATTYEGENRARRALTAATTSELCLNPLSDDQCNVCGLLFQPLPILHFPGNMWSAKCSYVRQLLTPAEYQRRGPTIDAWAEEQKTTAGGLLPPWPRLRRRRRQDPPEENWVASHPSIRPCDVSQAQQRKEHWLETDTDFSDFEFGLAPRNDIAWHRDSEDSDWRLNDSIVLHLALYRWLSLYQMVPDPSSWVWTWFPKGEAWKQDVAKHGTAAVIGE